MKKYLLITILLVSSFLLHGQFTAREVSRTGDIPDLISFQGRLTDNMGNPLNSSIDIIFKIYAAETGGAAIWMEDRNVQVTDGLFQLNLGEELPLNESYFAAETRWLGVTVAADAEMTPRIRIASAPYALNALETDPTWDGDSDLTGNIGRTGNVGIGIYEPLFPLHISGSGSAELQKIYNNEDQPASISFGTIFKTWRIGQNKPPDQPTFLDGFFIYDVNLEQTRLYISNVNGNIGIGSINPTQKLDVDGQIRIRGGSPAAGRVLTSNATGVATWEETATLVEIDPTWSGDVNTTGDIGRTGSVGIGTDTPTSKLDVDGQIRIRGGSPAAGRVLTSNATGVATWEEASTLVEIDPTWSGDVNTTGDIGRTGSVGIGTATPGAKLDVSNGDALIHGHTIGRGGGAQTSNFAAGYLALSSNTIGYYNTAVGYQSMINNTTGDANTAHGYHSLYNNTEGHDNTAAGYRSLNSNTEGFYNVAVGSNSLTYNTTGHFNTAVGALSLTTNTTGLENSAGGYRSLQYNQTGNKNTAFGAYALNTNSIGSFNTATGYKALQSNTSGSSNTGVGFESLTNNTGGLANTAMGEWSLQSNITGNTNTAIGASALRNNSTGNNNTGIGFFSLYENTTGYQNTSVGSYSGDWRLNIANGTFIGYNAFSLYDGLTNIAGYGYYARPTASNQVRMGNSSVTSIGGYAGWTNLSDSRYKKDIEENVQGLEFIMKLRPITYHLDVHRLASYLQEDRRRDENGNPYIASPDNNDLRARYEKEAVQYTGFIAQEVEAAAREVGFDFSGVDAPKNDNDLYGLRYAEFVVPLVKAVQEQQEIIDIQNEKIDTQQKQIDELMNRISTLENR